MTQKYKELLLKDLSARLYYGVLVHYCNKSHTLYTNDFVLNERLLIEFRCTDCCVELRPYLRSMSSMTKEELHEVQEILGKGVEIREDFIVSVDSSINSFTYLELIAVFEWFNAHHFDYSGLIEKGLAIEVTESNNPYKE